MQCLSAATGAGADTDLDSLAVVLADVATLVSGSRTAGQRQPVPEAALGPPWKAERQFTQLSLPQLVDPPSRQRPPRSCRVPSQVCSTLAQCGELFLPLPGVSATPLLAQALAAEDSSSADLLFDTGKEAEAWKVRAPHAAALFSAIGCEHPAGANALPRASTVLLELALRPASTAGSPPAVVAMR